ncbi:MAG: hypothetical protein ACRYG8_44175 [Janthinobacterium lividum]
MANYRSSSERWAIIFEENDTTQLASAEEMLTYFRDWRSWLELFAAAQTGQAAKMTMHVGPEKVSLCKVIHADLANPRSTYENPFGRRDFSPL